MTTPGTPSAPGAAVESKKPPFRGAELAKLVAAAQGALAEDRQLMEYLSKTLEDESQVAAFMRSLERHEFAPDDPAYLLLEHHKLMDESIRRAVGHFQRMLESQTTVVVELTRVMHAYAELGGESLVQAGSIKEWLESHHGALKDVLEAVSRVSEPGGMSRGRIVALVLGGGALAGLLTGALMLFAGHMRGLF